MGSPVLCEAWRSMSGEAVLSLAKARRRMSCACMIQAAAVS